MISPETDKCTLTEHEALVSIIGTVPWIIVRVFI